MDELAKRTRYTDETNNSNILVDETIETEKSLIVDFEFQSG